MNLIWNTAHSKNRPEDIDYTSSHKIIYLHRNIKEVSDEENEIFYEYEEAQINREEFPIYSSVKILEKLDEVLDILRE